MGNYLCIHFARTVPLTLDLQRIVCTRDTPTFTPTFEMTHSAGKRDKTVRWSADVTLFWRL